MLAGWIGGRGKQRLVGWWFSASRRYPRSGPRLPLQPVRPTWVCLPHACHTHQLFPPGRVRWDGRTVVTAREGPLITSPLLSSKGRERYLYTRDKWKLVGGGGRPHPTYLTFTTALIE